MGKRGPTPKRADGFHVTSKGYLRKTATADGKLKLGHVLVWEAVNGPVSSGYQIHHLNDNKQDNRIENLILVDATTHKRLHSGCEIRDGEWWKPCHVCGVMKLLGPADWYLNTKGQPLYGRCRQCHIRIVVEKKKEKRLAQQSLFSQGSSHD